ncbi:Hsp20/alpha crystallin family protein [Halorhabdus amylolytica]|uniref:Hsp20/alpha crystallin family protein n=1 Tax=Halorhabdus amylolytica TaxID=2559573 RepID=UPI0010AAE5FE|nr:Hsp20/alpha crystallin family protein [Halorhabdus amylolytica]
MNQLREFTETIGESVLENVGRAVGRAQEHTPLPVDLLESEEAYLAVFDTPGAQGSDVQVRLDGRTVEVRIDRFREYREGFEMRFPGRGQSLDGRVTLPAEATVEGDAASATLQENGTLHVRIPKSDDDTTVDVAESVDDEVGGDEDD